MGYIKHHAIVVTGTYGDWAAKAKAEAVKVFSGTASVTSLTGPDLNDTRSFMVAPDGSKEGWEGSDKGDAARDRFIEYLRSQQCEDGSSPLSWAEVVLGSDDREAHVERHTWKKGKPK